MIIEPLLCQCTRKYGHAYDDLLQIEWSARRRIDHNLYRCLGTGMTIAIRGAFSAHKRRPSFFIPFNSAPNPLHRLSHAGAFQRTYRQYPAVSHSAALLSFKYAPY